jgi:hypothetical protein
MEALHQIQAVLAVAAVVEVVGLLVVLRVLLDKEVLVVTALPPHRSMVLVEAAGRLR